MSLFNVLCNNMGANQPHTHTHTHTFCHMKAQRSSNDEGVESHDLLCTVT